VGRTIVDGLWPAGRPQPSDEGNPDAPEPSPSAGERIGGLGAGLPAVLQALPLPPDPLTRAQPATAGDISSSDTPLIQPGETLPVKVEVKTRTGWAVATDSVYAGVLFGAGPNSCRPSISGVKAYDQRPTALEPCNSTSNATTCFR